MLNPYALKRETYEHGKTQFVIFQNLLNNNLNVISTALGYDVRNSGHFWDTDYPHGETNLLLISVYKMKTTYLWLIIAKYLIDGRTCKPNKLRNKVCFCVRQKTGSHILQSKQTWNMSYIGHNFMFSCTNINK